MKVPGGRIFVVNVGTNASHAFTSPIFADRSFEFLPIPEIDNIPPPNGLKYADLRSFYDPSNDLNRFIPERFLSKTVHNDPEFDTFTYGDNCDVNPRASALKKVKRGDILLFIARLQHWADRVPTNNFGFYFIGFLHVNRILGSVKEKPSESGLERFSVNAHVRMGMFDISKWNSFWVFGGSSWSRRFSYAVPVTKEICNQVFRSADGSRWKWGGPNGGRSDLQVIGSYTRSCRYVIDQENGNHVERSRKLWNWIRTYSESADPAL